MAARPLATLLFAFALLAAPPPLRGENVQTSRKGARALARPDEAPSFSFAILGDRTTGDREGLAVLRRAVEEINAVRPDFVVTVGDHVQGYCDRFAWTAQMQEVREILDRLEVPLFPAAGNHDIYWRGEGRPEGEHESDFEAHVGPLWYAFRHKGSRFIVLYTDEGDPETGEKNFSPAGQVMSPVQKAWLAAQLRAARGDEHVFCFQHHPRWMGQSYGDDWNRVHALLAGAGNVSAVFAGHTHVLRASGVRDGIAYHVLGTTGGTRSDPSCAPHHWVLVTVRGPRFHAAVVEVGAVSDFAGLPDAAARAACTEVRPVLAETKWHVKSEETRVQGFRLAVPDFDATRGLLRIAVGNGADDTGDKGIRFSLLTADGDSVLAGFLDGTGVEWIESWVPPRSAWILLLADLDTGVDGRLPGNAGTVAAELRHPPAPPARDAGLSPNLLRNPGCEEPVEDGRVPGWETARGGPWGPRRADPHPAEGAAYFCSGDAERGELRQDVDLEPHLARIRSGGAEFLFEARVCCWKTGHDAARVVLEFLDADRRTLAAAFDSGETSTGDWRALAARVAAPEGARFARVRLLSRKLLGQNNDGFFDAVTLRAVTGD